ncbi:hypothetical protein [Nocardioides marmoribigeumensis]|uniref:Uncharacterized protein n=1 Tax=Nocardioides marmoribigeumensis TaxID=433649 RepID=A0ABU2BU16_9ACTN|nr:hypothetical protein [Nocardioides marmoribigeumensis]MDR7362122.1 hypothetical protein [Nocardioides marmoribigeumensis]
MHDLASEVVERWLEIIASEIVEHCSATSAKQSAGGHERVA